MASNRNMPNCGFASMDDDKQRDIARKGRERALDEKRRFSKDHVLATEAGRKGGRAFSMRSGSFARHLKIASDAGRKISRSSGGTFANDHAVGSFAYFAL